MYLYMPSMLQVHYAIFDRLPKLAHIIFAISNESSHTFPQVLILHLTFGFAILNAARQGSNSEAK